MNETSWIAQLFLSQGIPLESVILLLMLPVVVTLIAFFRQIVGIKAFGIYTPTIITFAFYAMGLKYAIAVFVAVIAIGMISRMVLRHIRLLYLPRVALTIIIISFIMLVLLLIGGSTQRTGLAAVSIFPLLIMITLSEKFIATQIEKGTRIAINIALETLAIALIGSFLLNWDFLRHLIISFPWIILFTIPITILLGKWTGLRITEIIRFREILKKI